MLCTLFFFGCASIVSKTVYPVIIDSTPSDAKVVIKDRKGVEIFTGQTPTIVKLNAGHSFFTASRYTLVFSAPGYSDKTTTITATLDGWYLGNIFFGGLIGMLIVDPATGAMFKIQEEMIYQTLESGLDAAQLHILDINDVPEDLKHNMVRLQ